MGDYWDGVNRTWPNGGEDWFQADQTSSISQILYAKIDYSIICNV